MSKIFRYKRQALVGPHSSLSEAIDASGDGEVIILEAGCYVEKLLKVHGKKLSIMSRSAFEASNADASTSNSAAPAASTVVQKGNEVFIIGNKSRKCVLEISGHGSVTSKGVSYGYFSKIMRGLQEDSQEKWKELPTVINVVQGSFSMTSGKIYGKLSHGIIVKTGTINLDRVEINRPASLPSGGVNGDDGDEIEFEAADVDTLYGVAVEKKAKATITNSILSDCIWNGIYNEGKVEVSGTTFSSNNQFGLDCTAGSLVCKDSTFKQNGITAIFLAITSSAEIENSSFCENRKYGAIVTQGSKPTFTKCKFDQNGEAGLLLVASSGLFTECTFGKNGKLNGNGVIVQQGLAPIFQGCSMENNFTSGCEFTAGSKTTLKDCIIKGNLATGLRSSEQSSVLLVGCEVAHNKKDGVIAWQDGAVELRQCKLIGNSGSGIRTETHGEATVEDCFISENATFGAYTVTASMVITGTHFNMNKRGEISAGWDAFATVTKCKLAPGVNHRVLEVSKQANPGCSFQDNLVMGQFNANQLPLIPAEFMGGFVIQSRE